MKNKLTSLILTATLAAASLMGCVQNAPAQTASTNAPGITPPGLTLAQEGTFVQTLQSYFTSIDTNSTTFHKTNELDIIVGADTQAGITSASLGINYSLWGSVGLDNVTRGAGIGGVIVSEQAGVSFSKVWYDIKFTGYLDGGWDFNRKDAFGEFGLRVFKALTPNTGAGIGIGLQGDKGGLRTSPVIGIFTVISF